MHQPASGNGRIPIQPAQHQAIGIPAPQQIEPFGHERSGLEAGADRLPTDLVVDPSAPLGSQLQPPGQRQRPPVATAFTGPVQAFVKTGHGRHQGIGKLLS